MRPDDDRDPAVRWPGGARSAAALTFDFDAESVWVAHDPLNAGRPCVLSMGAYGARRGVPLLLELLARHELRATFYVVGEVALHHRGRVEAIAADGHELAVHGWTHAAPASMRPDQHVDDLARTRELLERIGGRPVSGYRSPSADFGVELVQQLDALGFRHSSNHSDDVHPYLHPGTQIVELPTSYLLDDAAHWWFSAAHWTKKMATNGEVREIWDEELAGIHELGGLLVPMMHPQIVGRPGRLRFLDGFLAHLRAHEIWIATAGEVAAHAAAELGEAGGGG